MAHRARAHGAVLDLLAVGAWCRARATTCWSRRCARLTDLPWRLTIVGDRDAQPDTARALDAEIARLGLAGRITFAGRGRAKSLRRSTPSADLFVLPSRFEGYGMAYAEAIAHGLPVVGTTAGAIPETVPAGAGVLVPPDDVDALAACCAG